MTNAAEKAGRDTPKNIDTADSAATLLDLIEEATPQMLARALADIAQHRAADKR